MRQIFTVSAVLLLVLLSMGLLLVNARYFENWDIQSVHNECPMSSRYCRIAVDSHDRPHIAFTQDGPRDQRNHRTTEVAYASYNGSVWAKQTLGFGMVLGLTLDSNDNPHILYLGEKNVTWQDLGYGDISWMGVSSHIIVSAGLMYAKWTGSNWTTTQVDPQDVSSASFALDKSGTPHIAYTINGTAMKYAVLTKSGFNTQIINTSETSVDHVSLGLGSDDKPQILYDTKINQESNSLALKYLIFDNSTWLTKTLYTVTDHSEIVLDSHNQPHFTFFDGNNLTYARFNDSIWSTQTITGKVTFVGHLCLDSHDYPNIIFSAPDPVDFGVLRYAKWTGQAWNFQNIYTEVYPPTGPIVTDSKGNPHITITKGSGYAYSCLYITSDQSVIEPSPSSSSSFPSNEITVVAVVLVSLLLSGLIYAVLTFRKR